jgi:hypothetical protein
MKTLCPQCNIEIIQSPGSLHIHCPHCNTAYSICPECGNTNPPGQRYCNYCSATIIRTCAACRQDNWAGEDVCQFCGKPLDILESLANPASRDARARLLLQQEQALSIKRQEAIQAESRMEHFRRIEQQRQQELARNQERESKRERQTIVMIVLLTALVLFSIIIATLIWASQAP